MLLAILLALEWTRPTKPEIALHAFTLAVGVLDAGLAMRCQAVRPGWFESDPLLPERPSVRAWLTAGSIEALASTALWLALPDWRWRIMLDTPLAVGHAWGAFTGAQVLLSARW